MPNYCKYCGSPIKNPEKDSFCQQCGNSLTTTQNESITGTSTQTATDVDWFTKTKLRIVESTRPTIEKTRTSFVTSLNKLINDVEDPSQFKFGSNSLSSNQRVRLERSLADIRNKIGKSSFDEQTEDTSEDNKKALAISEELLQELRNDPCIVCYGSLKSDKPIPVIVCPRCGRGGHANHLEDWIGAKGTCPVCREQIGSELFFHLTLAP